ncbi:MULTISPECIES: transposase [Pseudomonas]|uniref:Transposase n=1 Tax=Pseudomonas reinekei TaxID=395598 RepID=A0A1H0PBR7_PSERE|nr:transposase [Pseudomonas reinekei]KAB0485754.1 transposase [Pseudomonas reinekei]OLU02606.1 transposase [Pseudomonas reinekei]SDP02056.1 hypothetical protein SAMN04490202_2593 [Pseudomonas reinekei]
MITGSKLKAPEGFKGLTKDVEYYFLASDGKANRARLVFFDEKGTTASLLTFSRPEFDLALTNGDLVECGSDPTPPWLKGISGTSVDQLEKDRVRPTKSYDEMVNNRYLAIANLVENSEDILSSDRPESVINAHADQLSPKQVGARLRFWFFTYLVFGRSKWALMPKFDRCGKGKRVQAADGKILGRPPKSGLKSRFPATPEMQASIINGFIKYNDKTKSDAEIFGDVLVGEFGCVPLTTSKGKKKFYQPEGKPFPTKGQYDYYLGQVISTKAYRKARRGPSGARAKSGFIGSFSHDLVNVNQLVEFDGYNPKGKISGLLEGSAMDSACVVRGVCGLSGAVVALGFSENKENMEAYRMALFSMAIRKVKFASLFGLTIREEEWPTYGLPQNIVFDRGPGSTMGVPIRSEAVARGEMMSWLSRLELTPTHSGQSKATVESSHPRTKSDNDQPTHFHSSLNFVEMSKRHILQAIYDNHASDAEGKMTPEMLEGGFSPTPHNIYKFYSDLGYDAGTEVSFDYAVREFLTPHPAHIKRSGVYFYGRKYNSSKLIDTEVFDRIALNGQISVTAYVMTMCVRHIWIELEGVLYELDFVKPASVHPSSVDISLSDLQVLNENRLRGKAQLREEQPAILQDRNAQFLHATGKAWDSGTRRLGRPAKGGAAERDAADQKRLMGKGHD